MNADTKEFVDHWWAKHGQEIFDLMVAKINSANEARKRAEQENERLIDASLRGCVAEMKVASVSRCVSDNFDAALQQAERALASLKSSEGAK